MPGVYLKPCIIVRSKTICSYGLSRSVMDHKGLLGAPQLILFSFMDLLQIRTPKCEGWVTDSGSSGLSN